MIDRFAACSVILLSVIANGCLGPSVRGSGHIVTESRNVSGFSGVSLQGTGRVTVEQGGADAVSVTGDDNLMQYIKTEVRGGTLILGEESGANFNPSKPIVFKVTLAKLDSLDLSGSGDVEATGIHSPKVHVQVAGSGNVSAEGAGDDLEVAISGSGGFHGDGLKSKRTRVDISGSGDALVAASDTLEASISGSGSIEYVGNPQVHRSISGSGSVRRR